LSSQSTKKTVGAARAALFVVLEALRLISDDFFSEGGLPSFSDLSFFATWQKKRFKKNDTRAFKTSSISRENKKRGFPLRCILFLQKSVRPHKFYSLREKCPNERSGNNNNNTS
jgi:hypothetical protein